MRRQNRTDNFFRNAKIKEEHKVVSERIKDLELQVKANNNKNHDAQEDFNTKMSKGPQTRADIETELSLLQSTMHEVDIKYHESKEKHEKELFTYDQRFRTINETALMVR